MGLNDDINLQCLLKFDSNLLDSSQNVNNGGLVGTPSAGSEFITGKFGNAVTRNTDGSVGIPHDPSISSLVFTVALWVKPTALVLASHRLCEKFFGETRNFIIYIAQSGPNRVEYTTRGAGGIASILSTSALQPDVWSHVAMTCTGSEISGYFDGSIEAGPLVIQPDEIELDTQQIGLSVGTEIACDIDDFRYYDRVLTPAEIMTLATNPYPDTGFNPLALFLN